jgi:predicted DNA-binding transcriptional regulator AlpA
MENERFLTLDQVAELVGLTTRNIKVHVREGRFPQPIPITLRTNVWRETEVREWMADRIADAPVLRAEQTAVLSRAREHRA